jgi:hypothetical protein
MPVSVSLSRSGTPASELVGTSGKVAERAEENTESPRSLPWNLYRERTAPLGRQLIIAALTVVLDAVACWFAAQAIGDDQLQTLVWAGLFLAVLASGEIALDYYRDRSMRAWRLILAGLAAFVIGLGVLRYLFLSTVGVTGPEAAAGVAVYRRHGRVPLFGTCAACREKSAA